MTATRLRTTARIYLNGDWVTVDVTIDVDADKIAQELAAKAVKNKTKRSRALRGGIEVTATPRNLGQ